MASNFCQARAPGSPYLQTTMNLLDLPVEILVMILLKLLGCEVERVAQTFNYRLTGACLSLPIIKRRAHQRKNARRMLDIFGSKQGSISNWLRRDLISKYMFRDAGFDAFGTYSYPGDGFRPCLDSFDLARDLQWMVGGYMDTEITEASQRCRNSLTELEVRATQLGLEIPQAFSARIRRGGMSTRILYQQSISCWMMLGNLIKIKTSTRGIGYIVKFGACVDDFQGGAF
jgi:hypothetical protein